MPIHSPRSDWRGRIEGEPTPASPSRGYLSRPWWAVVTAVGAGVVVAAGLGMTAAAADPSASGAGVPAAMPILPPLADPATGASAAGVAAALAPALAAPGLGGSTGAIVVDAATGEVLYGREQAAPRTPASTTKVLTALAALTTMGADHTLHTRAVLADDGTVVLVGAGDPLLAADPDPATGAASLADLARRTAAALAESAPVGGEVRIAVDDSLFTGPTEASGWDPTLLPECMVEPIHALSLDRPAGTECVPMGDPALAAGEVFAARLAAAGVPVAAGVGRTTAPASAADLAEVESPPMSALVEQMLRDSDNTSAEMLAHLAGVAADGQGTFAGGAAATSRVLADLAIEAPGLVLADGSGLSTDNRISPVTIADALDASVNHVGSQVWPVPSGLAVAGFSGTLATRFDDPANAPARGEVRAKTGTLGPVSALAGQVVTADGQLLLFAILADAAPDTLAARQALDDAATALAGCGCR